MRSRTKGPNRFSRFDVYWIQTNRHPDKLNLSMDERILKGLKGLGGGYSRCMHAVQWFGVWGNGGRVGNALDAEIIFN